MTDAGMQLLLAFSAAIVAALVLRKPVRSAFGARLAYALWLLPPLVALASFLPPRVVNIIASSTPAFDPTDFEGLTPTPDIALPVAAAPFDWAQLILPLWLTGAVAMAVWFASSQRRFLKDERIGKAGPAVVGFLRPRIVTPDDFDDRFDRREREVILTHETIHLRRHDARINALVALTRCLLWFNPLVHIGAHCLRIDQELACDAAVVARRPGARRLYADALLKAQLAARPLPLGCYWPPGSEHPLTERIALLKKSTPGLFRRIAGAGALGALALGAGVTAWAALPPRQHIVGIEIPQPRAEQASRSDVDIIAEVEAQQPSASAITALTTKIPEKPQRSPAAPEPIRDQPPAAPASVLPLSAEVALVPRPERMMDGPARALDQPPSAPAPAPILPATGTIPVPMKIPPAWKVTADTVEADSATGIVTYQGNVAIDTGTTILHIDTMKLDPKTGLATATGKNIRTLSAQRTDVAAPYGSIVEAELAARLGLLPGEKVGPAFASLFDAEAPILFTGKVTKVEFGDPSSFVWVETPDGNLYKVMGSRARLAPDWMKEPSFIGKAITVRGYQAKDRSCADGCLVNGRDVTVDGVKREATVRLPLPPAPMPIAPAMPVPIMPREPALPPLPPVH